jgi:hypothetical protein
MWIYLIFAMVVLPTAVPLMGILFEPTPRRRWRIAPFVVLGAGVSIVLLEAMLVGHPSVRLGTYHLAYSIGLRHGVAVIGLYIVATCGSLLVSGFRPVVWFGLMNLVAVIVLALLCASGFTSLWCFYAALVSGALATGESGANRGGSGPRRRCQGERFSDARLLTKSRCRGLVERLTVRRTVKNGAGKVF